MKNEIKISFNSWSKSRLVTGKRATSRTKIYGEVGDWFPVDGKEYEILEIIKFPTNYIINFLYNIEGAVSSSELKDVLTKIFRGHKLPSHLYVHFFIEVKA